MPSECTETFTRCVCKLVFLKLRYQVPIHVLTVIVRSPLFKGSLLIDGRSMATSLMNDGLSTLVPANVVGNVSGLLRGYNNICDTLVAVLMDVFGGC